MRGHGRARGLVLTGILTGILTAAAATVALPAAPAAAHATVVRTVPAEQSALDTPPDTLAVEFSEPVLDVGTEIKLLVDGATLFDDRAAVEGATISHPLGGELPAGSYQVLWRATSVDGHVVSGAYLFSVASAASRPPAAGVPAGSTADATRRPGSGAGGGSDGGSNGGSNSGSGGGRAQWFFAALAAAGAGIAVLGSRRRFRSAARG